MPLARPKFSFFLTILAATALATIVSPQADFCGTCITSGPLPYLSSTTFSVQCNIPNAKLTILFVTYGDPPTACNTRGTCDIANATSIITSACEGQNNCSVPVNVDNFGSCADGGYPMLSVSASCSVGTGAALCSWAPPPIPRPPLLIDTTNKLEIISPSLFGLDLEFTRHDIYNGLSAEVISNRLFALQPAGTSWPYPWPANQPPHWTPIGNPTFAVSQGVMCDFSASPDPCGIFQAPVAGGFNSGISFGASIGVQEGQVYTLVVVALATSPGIGINVSLSQGILTSSTLNIPGTGQWTTLTLNFTSPVTVTNATLTLLGFAGINGGILVMNASSLLPANHWFGMRNDVIDAVDNLGFTGTLRYPGGCFAPFYKWKPQLFAPRETRPVIMTPPGYCTAVSGGVNAYSDGFLDSAPNVDEYIALCRRINATPAITVSLQFGTPEEISDAHDLVEYTNGNASTPWGSVRASRGFPEPYNVSVWYLGNEIAWQNRYPDYPSNPNGQGPPTAAEYAAMLDTLVPTLRAVDPTIKLSMVEAGASWDAGWAKDSNVAPYAALTSNHDGYKTASGGGGAPEFPDQCTNDVKYPDRSFLPSLQALRSSLNALGMNDTQISADEWGLGPPWTVDYFNCAHGMFGASLLSTVINNAPTVGLYATNYFEPINEGAITVNQFTAEPTPLGIVMPLFSAYGGLTRLLTTAANTSNPDDDVLVVAGIDDANDGDVLLTLTNRNSTHAYAQKLSVILPVRTRSTATDGSSSLLSCAPNAAVTRLIPTDLSHWMQYIVNTSSVEVTNCTTVVDVPPYGIVQVRFPIL